MQYLLLPGFAVPIRFGNAVQFQRVGKINAYEIPESLFDLGSDRFRQPVVHDIVNLAEIKEDRQVIDDAIVGVNRHTLVMNR